MIEVRNVHFRYQHGEEGAGLSGVDLHAAAGEVIVVTGSSGCGKTTLTRLVNGLIPHFFEGDLSGEASVAGRVVADTPPAEAADVVGSVFQNPRSQFFTVDVGSELAFAAENLGQDRDEILARVTESAQQLGLDAFMDRSIFQLSGGQKQKVACGSVWVSRPPRPRAGRAVLQPGRRHHRRPAWPDRRMEGRRLHGRRGRAPPALPPRPRRPLAAHGAGADHPRVQCRRDGSDGRRDGRLLRVTLSAPAASAPTGTCRGVRTGDRRSHRLRQDLSRGEGSRPRHPLAHVAPPWHRRDHRPPTVRASRRSPALSWVSIRRRRGILTIDGDRRGRKARLATSFLVMQDVNHQLFTESVTEEIRLSAPDADDAQIAAILAGLDLTAVAERHPMSLSGGQKQRVAIAAAVASDADVVIFDEPTSGLDLAHMAEVAARLEELVAAGRLVIVVTHDDELVEACADYVVRLDGGQVVSSGPLTRQRRDDDGSDVAA
jgi:energy-coupling factor transporter ATP-binding protein EcfA2